jgi:hypothetical protein
MTEENSYLVGWGTIKDQSERNELAHLVNDSGFRKLCREFNLFPDGWNFIFDITVETQISFKSNDFYYFLEKFFPVLLQLTIKYNGKHCLSLVFDCENSNKLNMESSVVAICSALNMEISFNSAIKS